MNKRKSSKHFYKFDSIKYVINDALMYLYENNNEHKCFYELIFYSLKIIVLFFYFLK